MTNLGLKLSQKTSLFRIGRFFRIGQTLSGVEKQTSLIYRVLHTAEDLELMI